MESLTLPLAELKPALIGLGKVLQKRSTLPVLSMIKIERTAEGWIALTATDLDTFVTVRLDQPAEGAPFGVLVPYEDLQTAAKSCGKTDALQIHPLPDNEVSIKTPVGAGWAETRGHSLPVGEFPMTPKFDGELASVPDSVRNAVHEALECASRDETRLVLNGAYLDVSDKKCHAVVGTDGRHLYASNSFTLSQKDSVIIPGHRFLGWKEFNADGEWRLKTSHARENQDVRQIQLSTRRWRFISRQIDGNYPNWRQVVPKPGEYKISVEIEPAGLVSMLQAIQRMPDHDQRDHAIGLAVEGDGLLLLGKANAADSDWFSVPIAHAKVTGARIRALLNREILTKALQFGLTRIELIDPLSPIRFVQDGRQMIVMPVRTEGPVQASVSAPVAAANGQAVSPVEKTETPIPAASTNAASTERSQPMPETSRPNGGTKSPATLAEKPALEMALAQVELVRGDFRNAIASLNKLGDLLKQVQREHKAGEKEIQSVRATLRSLQSVRI